MVKFTSVMKVVEEILQLHKLMYISVIRVHFCSSVSEEIMRVGTKYAAEMMAVTPQTSSINGDVNMVILIGYDYKLVGLYDYENTKWQFMFQKKGNTL